MKIKFNLYKFLTFASILLFCLLSSCKSDDENVELPIEDVAPLTVKFYFYDVNGNNLLNPEIPNSLFGKNISIDYEGNTYPAGWAFHPWFQKKTKLYMAIFEGLNFYEGEDDCLMYNPNKNYLVFGEFDGLKSQDLSLILKIEDRPELYNIEVSYKSWDIDHRHHSSTIHKLNGVEGEGSNIMITLE